MFAHPKITPAQKAHDQSYSAISQYVDAAFVLVDEEINYATKHGASGFVLHEKNFERVCIEEWYDDDTGAAGENYHHKDALPFVLEELANLGYKITNLHPEREYYQEQEYLISWVDYEKDTKPLVLSIEK